MSDKLYPIPIESLAQWMLRELEQDSLFGVPRPLWFEPQARQPYRMQRYGQLLETPIGLAAGPHTQLAQNIIAGWLCGARYMELKTVQTLDNIEVAKPCIDMSDEGYNCEWSQELELTQSFSEYLDAWILLHWLRKHLGWDRQPEPGFIFNMSVGYDLTGIRNANVQQFLDRMSDSGEWLTQRVERLKSILPGIEEIQIPATISNNITLSTMHGCPPDEIERIGQYLIRERRLHTTIKLNPTLLGPDRLPAVLNEELGFTDIRVPEEAFVHDLTYAGALDLIRSLQQDADEVGVKFGVKLTNTLEVENLNRNLPGDVPMVYMSGRALHPISVLVAERLQTDFQGHLDISFSAGVDAFNVAEVLECNIRPVTMCSDLLKPGGYTRLKQYLDKLDEKMRASGAADLNAYILSRASGEKDISRAGLENLQAYAATVVTNERYHHSPFAPGSIKTNRALTTFDCIAAPCIDACAVHQDIPSYMYHTARGDFHQALEVILRNNPFPHVAGLVCDHLCQTKCTRMNYDRPLLIRGIKHFIAQNGNGKSDPEVAEFNGKTVAIIGGGPAGLSAAYFLIQDGFEVEVFESGNAVGGMAAHAIPSFRLDEAGLRSDVERIKRMGVIIHTNAAITLDRFNALRNNFDYIFIAVGAQNGIIPHIPGGFGDGVWDQLTFLASVHKSKRPELGQSVVVIGGGNSAMDAARTARRLVGQEGNVRVVYRRTMAEMPADPDEIAELEPEGIELLELLAPLEIVRKNDGTIATLRCQAMQLGGLDASGRPRPEPVPNKFVDLNADSIIWAVGQKVVLDFFPEDALEINPHTMETQLLDVFAGGDAVRGPATLIQAIGDGRNVARMIRKKAGIQAQKILEAPGKNLSVLDYQIMQAVRDYGSAANIQRADSQLGFDLVSKPLDADTARREASRCLFCDEFCSVCVGVCPNRANVTFQTRPRSIKAVAGYFDDGEFHPTSSSQVQMTQSTQVLNLADFCNECGNCTTFCPTLGEPYRTKPSFWLSKTAFDQESSGYHFASDILHHKQDGTHATLQKMSDRMVYEDEKTTAMFETHSFQFLDARSKHPDITRVDFQRAATMFLLWETVRTHPVFAGNDKG